jgi:hypothetical protein
VKKDLKPWLDYWITLMHLFSRKDVIESTMDIPLDAAVRRTIRAVLWSTVLGLISFAIAMPTTVLHLQAMLPLHASTMRTVVFCVALVVLTPILSIAIYGLLRLYTLVSHVMTINVFKTRGQRLRWLNAETTILSLTAPLAMGWALSRLNVILGRSVMLAVAIYALYLFSCAYHLIFHKKTRIGGLLLFLGSTLVAWFVLLIGALGVMVAFSIIWLFILMVLRVFHH